MIFKKKHKKERKHDRRGMTYIEVLVALALLALIVAVFTPSLMMAYSNLYNAGEITADTFSKKEYMELELAKRINDPKITMSLAFKKLGVAIEDSITVIGKQIQSGVEGLETIYGLGKARVLFVGKSFVNDDSSTQTIGIRFINIKLTDDSDNSIVQAVSGDQEWIDGKVTIKVTSPMNNKSVSSVTMNVTDGEIVNLSFVGVDTSYSPLKIQVYYYNENNAQKSIVRYLEIKPATMMFVGDASATAHYYTAADVASAGSLTLEGRVMPDLNTNNITVNNTADFYKVRWINNLEDDYASSGYYVMAGDNGIIRRLWHMSYLESITYAADGIIDAPANSGTAVKLYGAVDSFNKYCWAGDYTEKFSYGEKKEKYVGYNNLTAETWDYAMTSKTAFLVGGYMDDDTKHPNTQISYTLNSIARNAANANTTNGAKYNVSVSHSNDKKEAGSLKLTKTIYANWESGDLRSRYDDDAGDYAWLGADFPRYSGDVWVNTLRKINYDFDGDPTQDYPFVFFSYDDTKSGIDRVYLIRANNWGTGVYYDGSTRYWYNWNDNGIKGSRLSKRDKKIYADDIGVKCTETVTDTVLMGSKSYSFITGNGKTDAQNLNENRAVIVGFIEDFLLSGGLTTVPATSAAFTGGGEGDSGIAYVRLKGYTTMFTDIENQQFNAVTEEDFPNGYVDDNRTNTTTTLTDVIYVDSPTKVGGSVFSGSHLLYTGYTTAASLIYTTVPTGNAHSPGSTGAYRMFTIASNTNGVGSVIKRYADGLTHKFFKDKDTTSFMNAYAERYESSAQYTMGYSSNRDLVYTGGLATPKSFSGAESLELNYPEEFKNILKYDKEEDVTVGVGYIVSGRLAAGLVTGNCTDSGHGLGSCYDLTDYDRVFSNDESIGMFRNVNCSKEGHVLIDTPQGSKKGFYLELDYTSFLSSYPTCSLGYTTLSTTNAVTNRGIVTLHVGGAASFVTLYTAPEGTNYRFTCVDVVYVGSDEVNGDIYNAYIGDSNGGLWKAQFYIKNGALNTTTGVAMSQIAANRGVTEARDVYYYQNGSEEYVIECGESNSNGVIAVFDETNDTAFGYTLNTSKKFSLYDIEYLNGYMYICGDYVYSGTERKGVVFYSNSPRGGKPTGGTVVDAWTAVFKDNNNNDLQSLYSVAVQK